MFYGKNVHLSLHTRTQTQTQTHTYTHTQTHTHTNTHIHTHTHTHAHARTQTHARNDLVVISFLKPGKKSSKFNSYRPIALTSHVCKLLERIILNRLIYHCDKNNIIPVTQAGFCKGRHAVDHLVKLTSQIEFQFQDDSMFLAPFYV